ncbi:MAG TPA: dTDP-glucose 4,6-dehydratase [Terriglobales bacterium]|nr:dTDP-glucose 4,6-dehydratase [Terriglobales bacterium]
MLQGRIMVTGGAGFIGSALCRRLVRAAGCEVLNVDRLTYAANLDSLAPISNQPNYRLATVDICDGPALKQLFADFRPDVIFHLAAESHVDRSIDGPDAFIQTNVVGTQRLLSAALDHWRGLPKAARDAFRFVHVSTDEVYGTLGDEGAFTEETAYQPNSPYAASKAAADLLARAWHVTYGLPVIISNCSNNYGPYQFPEKLIPHCLIRALQGETLPVYGAGTNIRDWLFVEDHIDALLRIGGHGRIGEKYNVGGHGERRNIDVVRTICRILDDLRPRRGGRYEDLITFVTDRPGHDHRYAIDAAKVSRELGWQPSVEFEQGLRQTVEWYLGNEAWWRQVMERGYRPDRLGQDVKVGPA